MRFRFTARRDYLSPSHKMLLHAIFTTLSLSWGESRDIILFTLQAGHIHREDFRMNQLKIKRPISTQKWTI